MSKNHRQLTIEDADASLKQNGLHLRRHQIEGIKTILRWHQKGHGGILADEMGLGKTCQAIIVAAILADQIAKATRILVISPLSVLEHWENEVKRFGCGRLQTFRYHGEKRDDQRLVQWNTLLTTYEIFLNDYRALPVKRWDIVIFDEAHRLKNSASLMHQALSFCKFDWILMMTGTPVQNNLAELYSLLLFADLGQFSPDGQRSFVSRFSKLGHDNDVSQQFRELFDKYCLRRNKKILSDVPACSEVIFYHGLSKLQYDMYRAILINNRTFFAKHMQKVKQARASLMSVWMHLCKCCDHPYLFPGIEHEPFVEGEHLVNESGKALFLDRLLVYLHKKGHRVLIFTQFRRFLDIVYDILTLRGYTCEQFDGSVRLPERVEAIQNFQRPNSDVFAFLLTTKAGGIGLNLTAADTVILLDWDFNPQHDKQAAARCHRIGQTKPVKIIRLVAKHTIEELIKNRAAKKIKLSEDVLGTDEKEGFTSFVDLSEWLFEGLTDLEKAQKKRTKFHILTDEQLEETLGKTDQNGHWEIQVTDNKENTETQQHQMMDFEEGGPTTLYMFEGHDYSEQRNAAEKTDTLGYQYMSMNLPLPNNNDDNEEEDSNENDAFEKQGTSVTIRSPIANGCLLDVYGDVTQPQHTLKDCTRHALILHAVDDRGHFGTGGLFTALRQLSSAIPNCYEHAHRMRDLHLGDVHLAENVGTQQMDVPLKYLKEEAEEQLDHSSGEETDKKLVNGSSSNRVAVTKTLSVALMVLQALRSKKTLNAHLDTLKQCLCRIRLFAQRANCSVHLARIWLEVNFVTEEQVRHLLETQLCAHGIDVYIYKLRKSERKQAQENKCVGKEKEN